MGQGSPHPDVHGGKGWKGEGGREGVEWCVPDLDAWRGWVEQPGPNLDVLGWGPAMIPLGCNGPDEVGAGCMELPLLPAAKFSKFSRGWMSWLCRLPLAVAQRLSNPAVENC